MRRWSTLLLLLCHAMPSVGCHSYSAVERHFLRVPAANAAQLSGIAREKWLKRARKLPGVLDQARENRHLTLPASSLPPGLRAPAGEVAFFPDEPGGRQGGVALLWQEGVGVPGAERLWLLKTEGSRYVVQSLNPLLPGDPQGYRFSFSAVEGAVVCFPKAGHGQSPAHRRRFVLRWQGGQWRVD